MTDTPVISLVLTLAVIACATAPAPPPSQTDRIVVTTETRVIKASEGTTSRSILVNATQAKVLAALRSAYSELGIEVKLYDPNTGQIGNRNFSKTNRLAGQLISTFLGCGLMVSGETADNYRVTMSVVSQVTRRDGGSGLETWLTAAARDIGTSTGSVSCASKGTLETKINGLVLLHIAG